MKKSSTTNKPADSSKIAPGKSANKPTDAVKNAPPNAKNLIKGAKGTPLQEEEVILPPQPKESKLFLNTKSRQNNIFLNQKN